MNDSDRLAAIYARVNILEGLHKTCQLSALALDVAVLNESRYLARALADAAVAKDGTSQRADALHRAELAVHSGINDAVDSLLVLVKKILLKLSVHYPKFEIATSSYGEQYVSALQAMERVETSVVTSREQRYERHEIYSRLADSPEDLKVIAAFALKLLEIEAIAQRNKHGANPDAIAAQSEYMLQALDAWRKGQKAPKSEFALFLQPKYEITAGPRRCVGAEALLRFKIGDTPLSTPSVVEFAESNQLIAPLGREVMVQALQLLRTHRNIPSIAVNVSALELLDPSYSEDVLRAVRESGVEPNRLELEITETIAVNDSASEQHLAKIADSGVRIAVDDFGTGQTKFDYLARMKVGTIKIDRSLVVDFDRNASQYKALISAIGAVGKACGISIVAEGVETDAQVSALADLGISRFQGFLYGTPVSTGEFMEKHGPNLPLPPQ